MGLVMDNAVKHIPFMFLHRLELTKDRVYAGIILVAKRNSRYTHRLMYSNESPVYYEIS